MTKLNVIGLTGYKGAGKDTAGLLIHDALIGEGQYVRTDMMAKGLKDMLAAIGYPAPPTQEGKEAIIPELGVSWRHMAQTLGTEWRQLIHPHLWLKAIETRVMDWQAQSSLPVFTIITDIRFDYEAEWIRKNGWLVHVLAEPLHEDSHISEKPLPILKDDFVIQNYRTNPHKQRTPEHLQYWCGVTVRTILKDGK